MEAHDRIMAAFREDLEAIISGEDQTPVMVGAKHCHRCGMTFRPLAPHAWPEKTTCAEPGCDRRLGHGRTVKSDGTQPVRVYAL